MSHFIQNWTKLGTVLRYVLPHRVTTRCSTRWPMKSLQLLSSKAYLRYLQGVRTSVISLRLPKGTELEGQGLRRFKITKQILEGEEEVVENDLIISTIHFY